MFKVRIRYRCICIAFLMDSEQKNAKLDQNITISIILFLEQYIFCVFTLVSYNLQHVIQFFSDAPNPKHWIILILSIYSSI